MRQPKHKKLINLKRLEQLNAKFEVVNKRKKQIEISLNETSKVNNHTIFSDDEALDEKPKSFKLFDDEQNDNMLTNTLYNKDIISKCNQDERFVLDERFIDCDFIEGNTHDPVDVIDNNSIKPNGDDDEQNEMFMYKNTLNLLTQEIALKDLNAGYNYSNGTIQNGHTFRLIERYDPTNPKNMGNACDYEGIKLTQNDLPIVPKTPVDSPQIKDRDANKIYYKVNKDLKLVFSNNSKIVSDYCVNNTNLTFKFLEDDKKSKELDSEEKLSTKHTNANVLVSPDWDIDNTTVGIDKKLRDKHSNLQDVGENTLSLSRFLCFDSKNFFSENLNDETGNDCPSNLQQNNNSYKKKGNLFLASSEFTDPESQLMKAVSNFCTPNEWVHDEEAWETKRREMSHFLKTKRKRFIRNQKRARQLQKQNYTRFSTSSSQHAFNNNSGSSKGNRSKNTAKKDK